MLTWVSAVGYHVSRTTAKSPGHGAEALLEIAGLHTRNFIWEVQGGGNVLLCFKLTHFAACLAKLHKKCRTGPCWTKFT